MKISNVKCPQEYFRFIIAILMHRKMTMETSDVIISELNRPWKFLAACLETLKISMEIAEVVLEYVFFTNTKSFLVKELPLLTLLNNV